VRKADIISPLAQRCRRRVYPGLSVAESALGLPRIKGVKPPTMYSALPGADSQSYHSVRVRPISRLERFALGRALRQRVPRASLGEWRPADDRPDPVEQIQRSHDGRVASLIPIRIGRMVSSPYGFLRGGTVVMAHDFSSLPATGITPVICGDAHLGNFGFYASAERDLVLDLNDFDEAHPGPWEWDLRRLITSIYVAGRQNGAQDSQCDDAVMSCTSAYRHSVRLLANQPLLSRLFQRMDVGLLHTTVTGKSLRATIARAATLARSRTSDRALPRFTTERNGRRHLVEKPPLVSRVPKAASQRIAAAIDDYLTTLAPHWRRVIGGYTLVDVARKVVGVSSVGLRSYVALLEGSSPDDVVFLQLKEARRSVVARYVHGEVPRHSHQGQRVVEYQQALQTVSDPLLGWTTIDSLPYYVRQFRDMKGAIPLDTLKPGALADYARVVGHLLAKGHARTSGASMIAGYLGQSGRLDDAMRVFARAYADQIEADHRALVRAVARGRLTAARVT
jgi:uncharacterized protein (DUF2252 family)